MRTRKQMKQQAKRVVRGHYWILLIITLVAVYLGSEFSGSLDFVKQYNPQNSETVSTGITTGSTHPIFTDAVLSALSGDIHNGKQIAQEETNEAIENAKKSVLGNILGRSEGVLASLVNGMDSGSIIVNLISAVRSIGVSKDIVIALFIGLASTLTFGIWFFLTNMYKAISRRIFLEARNYEKVPMQRIALFYRVKKWGKVSFTMFMSWLFLSLWSLTIIGGIIKRYSYYMVPYIVAENPNIKWKDAMTLSRKMMDGHKKECFIFECTFILWNILGVITLGITNLFYVNQYKLATFSEYYTDMRLLAKDNHLQGSELLNDCYLFEKADEQLMRKTYADVLSLAEMPDSEVYLKGFKGILARVFGITIFNRADEKKYEEHEQRQLKINSMQAIINGEEYPDRLFSIKEIQKSNRSDHIHYLRHYSIPSLILLFFIFSFIGWTWEVSLHLISEGVFVNRGVLHGPWLPIYGSGGILILTILNVFRKHPVTEFFSTIVLCGFIEYFTAYYLEIVHNGQKWWDYSGYFLNLDGRICAEGLLIFGLGGMAIVYFLAPLLDNHLRKLNRGIVIPICLALLIVFVGDQVYSSQTPNSGEGITSYQNERDTLWDKT